MRAMITGATSGIGWATAIKLAEQGYNILATGRRPDRLAELQELLQQKFPERAVRTVVLDISDRDSVRDFLQSCSTELAEVEVLVNNAGLARGLEKIQEAVIDDWERMIDTNIKGLLYVTRGVLPLMVQRNSGHIVNVGSVAGRWTYPGGGVYCATKFAVRALSEGLRMDLLGSAIRVTNIEPGMVETEFSVVRMGSQERADQVYEGMTPLRAEDIAETIAWCVKRPAHVNIQELVIYPTDQAHVGLVARKERL
ncbi:MAG: SDR family NAD(P)-dependent oxidoreductase [Bdellovibrio sp.]